MAVNTSKHADRGLKPDICFFNRSGVAGGTPESTDFPQVEFWIEFKRERSSKSPTKDVEQRYTNTFGSDSKQARDIRGQLAHYAGAHHAAQFRHFSFSALIADGFVKFLRWDPAGTVVSEPCNYRDHPGVLLEFLWRFNHLSAKDRGHDLSVRPANLEPHISRRIRENLEITDSSAQLFEYDVPGLETRGHAYGPRPVSQKFALISRCTRSLPTIWIPLGASHANNDPTEDEWAVERTIYLKDTWRFVSPAVRPEHEIYRRLDDCRTPNIPTLVAGNDVHDGLTRTQEFVDKSWLHLPPSVTPLCHYRLVLGVVGRALTSFTCTKELVSGVLDALKGNFILLYTYMSGLSNTDSCMKHTHMRFRFFGYCTVTSALEISS